MLIPFLFATSLLAGFELRTQHRLRYVAGFREIKQSASYLGVGKASVLVVVWRYNISGFA